VDRINALSRVRWVSMHEILATNYQSYCIEAEMRIRLFSRRVKLVVPEGIERLRIEANPFEGSTCVFAVIGLAWKRQVVTSQEIRVVPGEALEIGEVFAQVSHGASGRRRFTFSLALLRRLATEIRDQLRI